MTVICFKKTCFGPSIGARLIDCFEHIQIWFSQYSVYIDLFESVQRKFLKFLAYVEDRVYHSQSTDQAQLIKSKFFAYKMSNLGDAVSL